MSSLINPYKPLLTPIPFSNESLTGYMLRLSETNGYRKINWIFRNIPEIKRNSHIVTITYVEKLAEYLGLRFEDMLPIAYLRDIKTPTSHVSYFGQKIHLMYSTFEYPRLCPICIRDSISQGFWEIKYATTCPIHDVRLIDLCQQCDKRIDWFRTKASHCPYCRFDFTASACDKASSKVTELTKVMYAITNLGKSAQPLTSSFGLPIQELSNEKLNTFLHMMHITRHYLIRKELQDQWRVDDSLYSYRLNTEYKLVEALAEIMTDWPENFLPIIYRNFISKRSGWCSGSYKDLKSSGVKALIDNRSPLIFQKVGKAFVIIVEDMKRLNVKVTIDEHLFNWVKDEYSSL